MIRFSAVLAVSALALAACGSDSDSGGGSSAELSGADQELADAIAANLVEDDDGFAEAFDVDCIASGTVSALGGADRIESEYGVTAANPDTEDVDLSADDASKVAAAYASCGDLKDALIVGFATDGVTTEQAECVLADISSDDVQAFFEESLQGNEEGPAGEKIFNALFENFESCGG